MRAARPEDAAAIEAFLERHADDTMLLRENLRDFGPCGGAADRATRIWLLETADGIVGACGLSTAGHVFVACWAGDHAAELGALLSGERVRGIIGPSNQVRAARAALGLTRARTLRDVDEPLYALDLSRLEVPAGASKLRLAEDSDTDLLLAWRRDYMREIFSMSEREAAEQAARQVPNMLERKRLAVLEIYGKPISMTGFNAAVPGMVQVVGVYTPPGLRGRRYARRAVALHLEHVRGQGVRRAVLSASGHAASRAYEAIGFRTVGRFMLLMFDAPQQVDLP